MLSGCQCTTSQLQPKVMIPKKGNGQFASRQHHPRSLSPSLSLSLPLSLYISLQRRRIFFPDPPTIGDAAVNLSPSVSGFPPCVCECVRASITSEQNFQVNQQYLYAAYFVSKIVYFYVAKGLSIGMRATALSPALVPIVPPSSGTSSSHRI